MNTIGFFGFGHMAQLIFSGIDRANLMPRSQVLFSRRDASKAKLNEQEFGIKAVSLEILVSQSDLIFLCVRPQQVLEAFKALKSFNLNGKKVISILAGTGLSLLEKELGSAVEVIRAMPNIASEVNEGMTILVHGKKCSAEFNHFTNRVFATLGQIAVLPESLMDVATAMAGSGPGFVLRLLGAMAQVGIESGLPVQDSLTIASQTFIGAATLIKKGGILSELLSQIATPNGVTAAGFESMQKTDVEKHFMAAIKTAAAKCKKLAE